MINLYSDKSRHKLIIVLIATLIGSGSVYYTNFIVQQLAEREDAQVKLYAKELQFLLNRSNEDENGTLDLFLNDMIQSNTTIPTIWVNDKKKILDSKNIEFSKNINAKRKEEILNDELKIMEEEHQPIILNDIKSGIKGFIYYRNSYMLSQLRYFPFIQLTVIAVFAFLTYMAFNYSRRAEQNRVWIGLAKETAHQLGTPLSALMAWVEYFKTDPRFENDDIIKEIEKDVTRLEQVTARFSLIGSVPTLKEENVDEVLSNILDYLQKRISTKVKIEFINKTVKAPVVKINKYLFEWVIENICKNAVDAMGGVGNLTVTIQNFKDTGKGISKSNLKQIFDPGFSTKKRGWGLGLTLAKRIIENYHYGKIMVKESEMGKGTTFRIILNTTNVVSTPPSTGKLFLKTVIETAKI